MSNIYTNDISEEIKEQHKQKLEEFKNLQLYKTAQNVTTLEQYILQKSNILEKIKKTYLFPYLLNMEYLVGNIDSVKVTDDPVEEISPYLNIQDGINQTLNVKFNREELLDWELFRLSIIFYPTEFQTEELKCYILLRIRGNDLDLLIFGIINNRILKQDKIIPILNEDEKIKETKLLLGLN